MALGHDEGMLLGVSILVLCCHSLKSLTFNALFLIISLIEQILKESSFIQGTKNISFLSLFSIFSKTFLRRYFMRGCKIQPHSKA